MQPVLLRAAIAAAAFVFIPAHADTPHCNKQKCVQPDVSVSQSGYDRALIAADPVDRRHLALSFSDWDRCGFYHQVVRISNDDGATWNEHCLPFDPDSFFGSSNDSPAVTFGVNGEIIAAASYDDGGDTDFVGVHRSTDNGANWSFGYGGGSGYHKGGIIDVFMAVDRSEKSPWYGNVYAAYAAYGNEDMRDSIRVAFSTNGGLDWAYTTGSQEYSTDFDIHAPSVAVASDGTAYMTHTVCKYGAHCHGPDVMLSRSLTGGRSWQPLGKVVGNIQTGHRPNLLIDKSGGPHEGRMYLVTDEASQITLRQSDDKGATWTQARRVVEGTAAQLVPWAELNRQGDLGVSWLDARNDPEGKKTQPMLTISTDGGATFSAPVLLDEGLTDLTHAYGRVLLSHAWAGRRIRAAFHGPDDNGADGIRAGGMR